MLISGLPITSIILAVVLAAASPSGTGTDDFFSTSSSANSDGHAVEVRVDRSTSTKGRDATDPVRTSTAPAPVAPAPVAPAGGARIATLAALPSACNNDPGCSDWPGAQLQTEPGDPGAPAEVVTIGDLARFLPAPAALQAEPDGWAVVGVPANFLVDADAVVVEAAVLGEAAEVRFTPQRYRWDYGDGAVRTTDVPGATWDRLGQEELTATPTSHVYRARARVQASVTVAFSAEYRVDGGGWTPVAGAVTGTAPPVPVRVVTERTVLTAGDRAQG